MKEKVKNDEITINMVSSKGKRVSVKLKRPEILGGAVALFYNGEFEDGEFVVNPLTNENMPLIRGEETRLCIPAHIKEDFEYSKAKNLPIKQVVAPYFYGTGDETVRTDIPTQKRHSVIAIIKHSKEDKYLCLDCKGRNCKSFVLGGLEKNENAEQAALREVFEETGYSNVDIDRKSIFKIINHFYAGYKGVNRYALLEIVFGHLKDERCEEISEEESKKHIVKWIDKTKLNNFININNNIYALDMLLNGESAWQGEGVMINSGRLDGLKTSEARKRIINILQRDEGER